VLVHISSQIAPTFPPPQSYILHAEAATTVAAAVAIPTVFAALDLCKFWISGVHPAQSFPSK